MRNLAGLPKADEYIRRELERARIKVVPAPPHRGEVPNTLAGELGDFKFTRSGNYWVATDGYLNLAFAEVLYDDPVGKTDIRVYGHCACPHPSKWAVWVAPDGRRVAPTNRRADLESLGKELPREPLFDVHFSDNPAEELDAIQCIREYHIDTEVGLRLFADMLKQWSLAGEPVPA